MFLLGKGKDTPKVLVLKPVNSAANGPLTTSPFSPSRFPFWKVQSTGKCACASVPQKTLVTFDHTQNRYKIIQ